ncbi:non-hydrolyzing UDP-N-acetylglucosamine 2-epimerase, partial [Photobacterium phosphoreum]|uniref:non-hydrolyzing UDP-N-acetylglucosamine 2-epimerase n=1 Tax=Photobacterium phosphoreum TaxID=659 RepID=UPI001E4EFF31
MKVLIVFGTRPEAIKMAPLVHELENRDGFELKVCVTAQHREILDKVLDLFNIKPDYDLNIMKHNQTLQSVVVDMLPKLTEVMQSYKPNMVLVHGDTATTAITSLAAFYLKIPIGHVEAGLRTYDIYSPWPEEGNRRITGVLSTLHFTPTEDTKKNLLQENVHDKNIVVTGNIVIDALFSVRKKLNNPKLKSEMELAFPYLQNSRPMVLITVHRRENHGKPLETIIAAIKNLATKYTDIIFVLPMHPNPNVKAPLTANLEDWNNIHLIEPQEYVPFVYLMTRSTFILSDSGGIQEEAPALGKPVLVLRNTTERPEAVKAGT